MDVRITTLAEHSEWVRWVAEEHFREWGAAHPGAALEAWIADRSGTRRDGVPLTLLALVGALPVGTAGLVACDMETHPELSPWLSGVYVAPGWRGRGIGTILVKAASRRAAEWGVRRLYLYTDIPRARSGSTSGWGGGDSAGRSTTGCPSHSWNATLPANVRWS